jgi:hypothetical protein
MPEKLEAQNKEEILLAISTRYFVMTITSKQANSQYLLITAFSFIQSMQLHDEKQTIMFYNDFYFNGVIKIVT